MGRRIDFLLGRPLEDRASEATPQQRVATGASATGAGLLDPLDASNGLQASYGFRRVGAKTTRDIPQRSRDQAQVDSIVAYRANPMGRAIIDTYTAFCVGDRGVTVQCTSPEIQPVVDQFWQDPRNAFELGLEAMFRDWLLRGEQAQEMLAGPYSGIVRRSPIDVGRVVDVALVDGNALWPESLGISMDGSTSELVRLPVIGLDDLTQLREGSVMWQASFKALETDIRGAPFLMPVLDWLDSYDNVLSNLIDRTALMRYISWDVTLKGSDGDAIDAWVKSRGGRQIPRSGTMEVHNDSVEMKPVTASTGAFEDVKTNQAVLTSIAGGVGLSKTWLAEPEDANRATSLTMAEPVRRRVGSVQNQFLVYLREMTRFAVDRAVAAERIPRTVLVRGAGGTEIDMPSAQTVSVSGPQIAAADSQVMATVLMQLSTGLAGMVAAGIMTKEAAQEASKKAWSDFTGVPYRQELDTPENGQDAVDDVATAIDDAGAAMPLVAA